MINKEEIEKLETTIEDYKLMRLNNCSYEVEGELFITLEKLLKEYKRQKEINEEHQKLNGELQQKLTKAENKNSIMEFNYQILQGEMDRIGIDTLKLEPGNSTDDVIDEIKKIQKKLTYYEDICKGKSIQELGMSNLYKED